MLVALFVAMRRAWTTRGPAGHGARAAWMMVVMIGIHSLDEYPLWYVYFLLPAALGLGFALGSGPVPRVSETPVLRGTRGRTRLRAGEELTVIRLSSDGVALALDRRGDDRPEPGRRARLLAPSPDLRRARGSSLATRIADGQRSVLFAHHADYADATTAEPPSRALGALERATTRCWTRRLMMAWSTALAESGQLDRARYVAARCASSTSPTPTSSSRLHAAHHPRRAGRAGTGAATRAPADAREADHPFQCQDPRQTSRGATSMRRSGARGGAPRARRQAGPSRAIPRSARQVPTCPPCFSSTRTPSITIPRSTALTMS
jgi:hypothetical protein